LYVSVKIFGSKPTSDESQSDKIIIHISICLIQPNLDGSYEIINVAVLILLTYDVLINVAVFMLLTYDRLITVAVLMLLKYAYGVLINVAVLWK
jgi:hypothetical protein